VATNVEVYKKNHLRLCVLEQKHHAIRHMVCYTHSKLVKIDVHIFLWTSSQIPHVANAKIPFLLWLIG
jgi:hypothetical protein